MVPLKKKINVLFCIAEADPFVKIGGLGDVAGSLPPAITETSQLPESPVEIDVRVVIPLHPPLRHLIPDLTNLGNTILESGETNEQVTFYESKLKGIPIYFIDGAPIANSDGVYSTNSLVDANKFIFFSLACLLLPDHIGWNPDIYHANDWHTAITVYALKALPAFRKNGVKTILSIHNLPYMGQGCQSCLSAYGIPQYPYGLLPSWAASLPLPMGLAVVDKIIAVSPGYAQEIQTSDFGCGLERLLQSRSKNVIGIINGIDTDLWNPAKDPFIDLEYDQFNLEKKIRNKGSLQDSLGLTQNIAIPLLGFVSRMDHQKGLDIVIEGVESLIDQPWQLVILGTGDAQIQSRASALANRHPGRIKTIIGFHSEMAHKIYAGSDIFLMPSLYEPCGISQMISMRYGTIPVARSTGGLKDTILATRPGNPGTGYLFEGKSAQDFSQSLEFALNDYSNQPVWLKIKTNAMEQNFSWQSSALKYIQEYVNLTGMKKEKSVDLEKKSHEN